MANDSVIRFNEILKDKLTKDLKATGQEILQEDSPFYADKKGKIIRFKINGKEVRINTFLEGGEAKLMIGSVGNDLKAVQQDSDGIIITVH